MRDAHVRADRVRTAAADAERFSYQEWVANDFARIEGAQRIGYEDEPDPLVPQKRLIEHAQTFYRADDLTGLLPLGTLESLALPGESHQLAFTAGLLTQVYGDRVDDALLSELRVRTTARMPPLVDPVGTEFFSPSPTDTPAEELAFAQQHFFTTHRTRDPVRQRRNRPARPVRCCS